MIPRMPHSYFIEVQERLRKLVDSIGPILSSDWSFIELLISQNELAEALDLLSAVLAHRGTPIDEPSRKEIARLVELMGLDPKISRQVADSK